MAMTYTTLTAPKGTSGSIANWVAYTKLDIATIVDEATSLLNEFLRCREMRSEYRFTIPVGNSEIALPSTFLDPIGSILNVSQNCILRHKEESYLQQARTYQETSGTLGTSPFTTTLSSSLVSVRWVSHGFNQGSSFYSTGATAVGGMTPNGTFPISSVTDVDNFVIDCTILGTPASSSASGGGSAVNFTCDNLIQGSASYWAIMDETIKFDCSFSQQASCSLLFFKQIPALSSTVPSNFITNRYPNLMRKACQGAAADFMKDNEEYQKAVAELQGLIGRIAQQDDLSYRGMEHMTEVP